MLPLIILGHVSSEQRDWRGVDSVARIVAAHRSKLTPVERAGSELLDALARGDADAVFYAGLDLAHTTPASVETQTHAAHLAVEANRPRDALNILSRLDPSRGLLLVVPWYWSWKCAALHELGDYEGQREVVEQGLRQFPDNPALLLHLGRALGALGREKDVLALMDRAPTMPPSSALHLAVLQRDAMALEWSRELTAHGNQRGGARIAALVDSRLEHAGVDTATRAVRLRAMALELTEHWSEARTLFAYLAARDPGDVSSRGHLAVADVHLGLRAEADRIDHELGSMPASDLHGLTSVWRARTAAARGDQSASAAFAAKAIQEGYMRGYDLYGSSFGEFDLHTDPFLASVRAMPEMRWLFAARD
jgi:tetratricopeptide (TPR) repeat protein